MEPHDGAARWSRTMEPAHLKARVNNDVGARKHDSKFRCTRQQLSKALSAPLARPSAPGQRSAAACDAQSAASRDASRGILDRR